jgi:hypothetical protein
MDSDAPARAAHVAVVKRWFEAWNDGDLDGMLACMDRGIEFHPVIYTVRDGLIVSAEQYLSDPQLMKQLGMLSAVVTPDGDTIACAHCGLVIEAQRPIVMVNLPDEAKFWHQQCFVAAYGDPADDGASQA